MNIIYIKTNTMKTFKAFNIMDGTTVGNVIYASAIDNNERNKSLLQEMAEERKDIGVVFQLKNNGKVVFQTK
jgi:hypothetical protein